MTSDSLIGKGTKKGDSYSAAELKVPVDSLKTGVGMRDDQLKKTLNSKKYPYIIVKNVKASAGKGTATIMINGITKPVSYTFKDSGSGTAVATFKLNLPDFKLENINFKGVGVEDEVEVNATVPYAK